MRNRFSDADRERLLNLFENLFRNSIEHGGDAVTVTVGWDDCGFFVADDGPDIPESRLEPGQTDDPDATRPRRMASA